MVSFDNLSETPELFLNIFLKILLNVFFQFSFLKLNQ